MTRQIVLFGFVALAACAGDTRKEERQTEQVNVPANLQLDREFITKAASGGQFEVESSRLVLSRQVPGEMTELAQHLIRDHSQANDRLEQLAEEKAVRLSEQMLPEHDQQLQQLRDASEEQLIPMFQQVQAQAHRETIALFERCARYCQDADVRQYAASTLPTLREHMQHIAHLQATGTMRPEERAQQTPGEQQQTPDEPQTQMDQPQTETPVPPDQD